MIEDLELIDFTNNALEAMYDTMESEEFLNEHEAEAIYKTLVTKLNGIPFCDYLKRYVYRKAELPGTWNTISDDDYVCMILSSFEENAAPMSFEPTTAKRTAMVRNWLRQGMVTRKTVLILGFGLRMTDEEVDDFLTKALREPQLNPKDPLEAICWYCFKNRLRFSAFQRLWKGAATGEGASVPVEEDTQRLRAILYSVKTEEELLRYVRALFTADGQLKSGLTALRFFEELLGMLGEGEALDPEKLLYETIPRDQHGNLITMKGSSLSDLFSSKRLSRQRISRIRTGKSSVNRFDLITLNFLVYGGKEIPLAQRRYIEFIETTDQILLKCGMGPVSAANPYECCLMMCMLSDDPVDTCAEVLSMSYGD